MPIGDSGDRTAKIRKLNDRLRTSHQGGRLMLSAGIAALDSADIQQILAMVAAFDGFSPDNDPYREHDCASVYWQGQTVLFKIDYYDLTLTRHSEDPTDPAVTTRVMTVMFASEY